MKLLASPRRDTGRRDFLAWMFAVPAVAGCSVAASPAGDGASELDDAAEDEIVETESANHTCAATTRDAEGPYFSAGSPVRAAGLVSFERGR